MMIFIDYLLGMVLLMAMAMVTIFLGGIIKISTGKRVFSVLPVAVGVIFGGTIALFLSLPIDIVTVNIFVLLSSSYVAVVIGLCPPFCRFPSVAGGEVVAQ